jgi:DNA replication protein DnaC
MHPADTKLRLSDITRMPGNEKMLEACKRMLKSPRGWLYIWGGPGNAKSIALRAMCNHLSLAGFQPMVYIKFTRLVETMRRANAAQYAKAKHFQTAGNLELWDNGFIDAYERLLKIKVLAIEEFDKARMTEFAQEFRFDFLDDRYEQAIRGETITMFASQDSPETLPAPLASRINSGKFIVVENTEGDARRQESWD